MSCTVLAYLGPTRIVRKSVAKVVDQLVGRVVAVCGWQTVFRLSSTQVTERHCSKAGVPVDVERGRQIRWRNTDGACARKSVGIRAYSSTGTLT